MPVKMGSIALLTSICSDHEDNLAAVVDFIKEPESADPIPPGLWSVPFELLDISAEIGLRPELGIDIINEPGDHLFPPRPEV
jgi:hypothetical protein